MSSAFSFWNFNEPSHQNQGSRAVLVSDHSSDNRCVVRSANMSFQTETYNDLNKSFYFDEDLELDLKSADDLEMEDANFELKGLSLNDEVDREDLFTKKNMSMTLPTIPTFDTEKLLAEAFDRGFAKKVNKSFARFPRKLGNNMKKRSKKVSSKPSNNCPVPCKTIPVNCCLPAPADIERLKCTNSGNVDSSKDGKCSNCKRNFSKKNLSRHLFISSCGLLNRTL